METLTFGAVRAFEIEPGRMALRVDGDDQHDALAQWVESRRALGPIDGLLSPALVTPGEALVEVDAVGTARDLPALEWTLHRRVALFREILRIVRDVHRAGRAFGPIELSMVLLDPRFNPRVVGPGLELPSQVAPTSGDALSRDPRADQWWLGTLLSELTQGAPGSPVERASVEEVVERCCRFSLAERFENLDALERVLLGPSTPPCAPIVQVEAELPPRTTPAAAPPPRASVIPPHVRAFASWGGALAALVGIALTAVVPAGVDAAVAAASIGAGALVLGLLPARGRSALALRVSAGMLTALVTFQLLPVQSLRLAFAGMGLSAGSPVSRSQAVRRLMEEGRRDLAGVDLSRAPLGGLDLSDTDLSRADLRGADLSDADLTAATLGGAEVAGAVFAGADITDIELDQVHGVTESRCDEDTRLPAGWRCDGGLIAPRAPQHAAR